MGRKLKSIKPGISKFFHVLLKCFLRVRLLENSVLWIKKEGGRGMIELSFKCPKCQGKVSESALEGTVEHVRGGRLEIVLLPRGMAHVFCLRCRSKLSIRVESESEIQKIIIG